MVLTGRGRAAARHRAVARGRRSIRDARARLLLGEALQRHGAREHAVVEFEAALAAFESLGAELDLQRAARLLAYGLPDNQYLEFND
jgi:hypothetical protein